MNEKGSMIAEIGDSARGGCIALKVNRSELEIFLIKIRHVQGHLRYQGRVIGCVVIFI